MLNRDKQLGVVSEMTQIISDSAVDPTLRERTWVIVTEAPDGAWGIAGHAYTNAEIAEAAKRQLSAS